MHKHYRRMMSDSLQEIQESHLDSAKLFMAYDGDNAGRLVGQAVLADDVDGLHSASTRIEHGHEIVKDWVQAHAGQVISGGGDEGTFVIPPEAFHDIEKLRKDYQYATDLTMTVGVGNSLSEAGKALMVGKFRGKDQVCQYDESIEQELSQAQAHIAGGNASQEEQKLGDAYLKPEGAEMNESEDTHDESCQYCAEMAEANTHDEDHCQYCHDMQSETEPHCQYCAEAEQKQAMDHEHSEENCEYCANANAQPDHEHSGDDCQYCAQAEQSHGCTGEDCQYCADANAANATFQGAAPGTAPAPDQAGDQSLQSIAQEIGSGAPGEQPQDVVAQLDGPEDMPGTQMQDGVSHPDNYGDSNAGGDMGMAEEGVPEQGPDLSQVLQGGLDAHSDNIQKEKVIQMASEALQSFKGCKDILERAKEQAPQLYQSSLAMLKAMIEMAKMLGLDQAEEQSQAAAQPAAPSPAPAQQAAPAQSENTPEGKSLGR